MADTWITNHQHGRTAALVASTNDHVDTINQAVQQARLDAGHLDPDTATRIAGGEHAHVGDVVATRRNDRRLTTTAGEPVRNRDTWTVTGIGDDGSLTVSHQGGHGDVTLPADYVREHVRLGYVATEHGWESDNVTAGICLASPATTRRGLYVAVTRGSDENVICVITDSNDVAEARDILDGIVAIDRADIPAVTQRRTLAQQQRQHAVAARTPRCVIPEWFEPLLNEARAELNSIEQRQAARAKEREQLQTAVGIADARLQQVDVATRQDRDALDDAERRAKQARWNHHAAQRRLDASPLRSRRSARRDVDESERQLDRATDYLERTRARTAPNVNHHSAALVAREDARRDLRHHDAASQLDILYDRLPDAQRRVRALETWRRWASGQRVTPEELHDTVVTLTPGAPWEQTPTRELGETIKSWASMEGIDLVRDVSPNGPAPRMGIELEL